MSLNSVRKNKYNTPYLNKQSSKCWILYAKKCMWKFVSAHFLYEGGDAGSTWHHCVWNVATLLNVFLIRISTRQRIQYRHVKALCTFIAAPPMKYSPWVTWVTAGPDSYLWEVLELEMNANGCACALVYASAMILWRFSPCRTMHSRSLFYTAVAIVHVYCLYLESVSAGKTLLWTAQWGKY